MELFNYFSTISIILLWVFSMHRAIAFYWTVIKTSGEHLNPPPSLIGSLDILFSSEVRDNASSILFQGKYLLEVWCSRDEKIKTFIQMKRIFLRLLSLCSLLFDKGFAVVTKNIQKIIFAQLIWSQKKQLTGVFWHTNLTSQLVIFIESEDLFVPAVLGLAATIHYLLLNSRRHFLTEWNTPWSDDRSRWGVSGSGWSGFPQEGSHTGIFLPSEDARYFGDTPLSGSHSEKCLETMNTSFIFWDKMT